MMMIKIGIRKKNHRRRHPFNNVDGYDDDQKIRMCTHVADNCMMMMMMRMQQQQRKLEIIQLFKTNIQTKQNKFY